MAKVLGYCVRWHTYVTENRENFKRRYEAEEREREIHDAFRVVLGSLYEEKVHLFRIRIEELTERTKMQENVAKRREADPVIVD